MDGILTLGMSLSVINLMTMTRNCNLIPCNVDDTPIVLLLYSPLHHCFPLVIQGDLP